MKVPFYGEQPTSSWETSFICGNSSTQTNAHKNDSFSPLSFIFVITLLFTVQIFTKLFWHNLLSANILQWRLAFLANLLYSVMFPRFDCLSFHFPFNFPVPFLSDPLSLLRTLCLLPMDHPSFFCYNGRVGVEGEASGPYEILKDCQFWFWGQNSNFQS